MPTARTRPEVLLDDLVDLFLAEGFRTFTLAQLAARLRCSKTTLYALGQSKEQLTVNAVRHYFRRATAQVETETAEAASSADRLVAYLAAIGRALRPASPAFRLDLAAHHVAREVYEHNIAAAAARVRQLIGDGVAAGEFRDVHAAFIADTIAATMERIQTGRVLAATGLHDADAYEELASLVLDGIRSVTAAGT
ncbi:transcriptional regulator, TetR family [Frankia casuarinae]|uniref:Transcriptional regulator, TetR family n=1 Tax=Frankia casuarinae (strain DSM 45818 / CECT 9043 / HFP020203 / CcI3) TaxID=106370 RepID=Q2J7Y1_FRACC|nr:MULTISPECIES: TetR family transcriptional regulator [Frankia]ABD12611.1 transcriptional regulator, TetR family [Frankia casuarinae]ESZ99957.1 transcriptional regulator, TetR family [Frankia sp. CcI6]EYT90855.1 transcriptional regulator, TetR family [Frankia casuarinae]KDA41859.1 transcriptional regulator, TetR family [Frankia sp. BMG5.23]KEZ35368.1 transcriptional regulator, TetR family [Frankia sp. CeD]